MASLGIGAITAGLSLGAIGARRLPLRLIAAAAGCACAGLVGLSAVRSFWPAAALLAGVGLTGTFVVTSCNTSLQLMTPDALRGRVMSLYILLSGGVFPIGAFVIGWISEAWGVSMAFAFNGVLGLLALAATTWLPATRP
jgi:MFS family permease